MNRGTGTVKRLKKSPRRFHHGDLREAAVVVAGEELERSGYAALTLESLARRLGVTRPALYRHFPDKRTLLGEVAQRSFVRFEAVMNDAIASDPNPLDALRAMGRAYLRFARANPEWFRLQFFSPPAIRPSPDLERTPARYGPAVFEALGALLGKDNPDLRAEYIALWALEHGLASLLVEQVWGALPEQEQLDFADGALRVHIDGLAARGRSLSGRRASTTRRSRRKGRS